MRENYWLREIETPKPKTPKRYPYNPS